MSATQPGIPEADHTDKSIDFSIPFLEVQAEAKSSLEVNQGPNQNDLRRIKGISPEVVRALNGIGIGSFDHLGSYTPDRLNNILKAQEPPIVLSTLKLETIIDQARKLAGPQTGSEPPKSSPAAIQMYKKKRQFDRHWKVDEWAELADFFISFGYQTTESGEKHLQTRAIHYEGEKEKQLENIALTELLEWMLNQAKPSLPQDVEAEVLRPVPPPAPLPPAANPEAPPLELSILGVSEVAVPSQIEDRGPSSAVRVESWMELPDSARGLTQDQIPFSVEAYLVNLQTRQPMLVASHPAQLQPGTLTYRITHDFPMPEVGRYQLYLAAHLLSLGEVAVHLQGPVIRVEV